MSFNDIPTGRVLRVRTQGRGVLLETETACIGIEPFARDLVRLRAVKHGQCEPETSIAVVRPYWPQTDFRMSETDGEVVCATQELTVTVSKSTGRISVGNGAGESLLRDLQIAFNGDVASVEWTQPDDRRIYACGERAGSLEARGEPMTFWNTDAGSYAPGADPLYQSIPFLLALDGSRANGVFLDNTFRQVWDLRGETARMTTDGGAVNLYVFSGPHPKKVISRFVELTGYVELPPLWSLGYHQCRFSYTPDSVVRELAREFRTRQIPCDAIWFDIHYMDGMRVFTWDSTSFPEPDALLSELSRDGFHTVAILDPGIKVEPGYGVYDTLMDGGFYVKYPNGKPYIGRVWPGDCVFPDFTDPKCREWWAGYLKETALQGLSGVWNDMNEPSVGMVEGVTIASETLQHGDGWPGTHARWHNTYGMQMIRASRQGLLTARPDERPFVLTRANYAGGQRFAAAWTGDNVADWESFRMSLPMIFNLGLSGQGFSGADIGGFYRNPTPELFARWLQIGALYPFCRVHSAHSVFDNGEEAESARQEPWSYGDEWTAINTESIRLRYRLLPYLYTLFEEMSRTGIPVFRPLFLEFPDDPGSAGVEDQMMLGSALMAAPVLEEGRTSRPVYLPPGTWFDWHTGEGYEGGRNITVEAPVDRLPLYARAGSAIPTQPVVQHTGEMEGLLMEWLAWTDGSPAQGVCYEDDGVSYRYQNGEFKRTFLTVSPNDDGYVPSFQIEGGYPGRPIAGVRVIR